MQKCDNFHLYSSSFYPDKVARSSMWQRARNSKREGGRERERERHVERGVKMLCDFVCEEKKGLLCLAVGLRSVFLAARPLLGLEGKNCMIFLYRRRKAFHSLPPR